MRDLKCETWNVIWEMWSEIYIFRWLICEVRNVKFCVKREFNFWKNALQETPLPHCWSQEDRQPSIRLEDNARRVHFEEGEQTKKRWSRSVLADCTIPETCGIFYYENTIVSDTRDATAIAVGLVTSGFDVNRSVNIFLPSAYAVRSTGASWRPFFWQNSWMKEKSLCRQICRFTMLQRPALGGIHIWRPHWGGEGG